MLQSKLQAATAMVLAVGVTVLGIARFAHSAPDPTAEDQKNLQGTWIMMTEEEYPLASTS